MTRHRRLVGLVSGVLMAGLMCVPSTLAQGPTDAGDQATEIEPSPVPSPVPSPSPSPIPSVSPSPVPSPAPSSGAPPNDDPSSPTIIGALPFTDAPDLTEATNPGEPVGYCGTTTNTVWYGYHSDPTQDIAIDLTGAASDVRLDIYLDGLPVGCVSGSQWSVFQVVAGGDYAFQLGTIGTAGLAPFTISEYGPPHFPPANDRVEDATVIGSLPFSQAVDLGGASMEPGEPDPCLGSFGRSAWFAFTPSTDVRVRVTTSGDFGVVALYRETWDDFTGECVWGWSSQALDLDAGRTYLLQLTTSWSYATVTVGIEELVPPPNDDLADATIVSTLPFSDEVQLGAATRQAGEPIACADWHDRTAWYTFTPTADVQVRVTAAGDYGAVGIYSNAWHLPTGTCVWYEASETVDLAGGETYLLQVSTSWSTATLALSLDEVIPPSNDDLADAVTISGLPFATSVAFRDATMEDGEPWPCDGSGATVWFAYEPPEDQRVEVRSLSGDPGVTVYADDWDSQVGCTWTFRYARLDLQAGHRYLFQVAPTGSLLGDFDIRLIPPPPPNDSLEGALPIEALPFEVLDVEMLGATPGGEDPPACFGPDHTVWYTIQADEAMNLDVSALGEWDVTVQVFGGRPGAQCARAGESPLRVRLEPGDELSIQLGSTTSETAGLRVELGPPPLQVDAGIAPTGSMIKAGGGVAVSGSITCTQEADAWMSVEVRQTVGRKLVIVGEASRSLSCGTETVPWTIFVFSDNGAYGGGSTLVTVRTEAWAPSEWTTSETSAAVRIRGQIRL